MPTSNGGNSHRKPIRRQARSEGLSDQARAREIRDSNAIFRSKGWDLPDRIANLNGHNLKTARAEEEIRHRVHVARAKK